MTLPKVAIVAACLCFALLAAADDPFPVQSGDNLMSSNVWGYLLYGTLERELAISEMTITTNTNSVVSTNWAYPNGYDRVQYVSSYRIETGLYISAMSTQLVTSVVSNLTVTNAIVLTNWSIGYSQTVSVVTGWFGVITNVSLPTRTNVLGRAITFDLIREIDAALLSMATNFIDYRGASPSTGIEEPMALSTGTNWFWLSNGWVQIDMGLDYDHYTYRETPPVWTISNAFQYLHIGTAIVYKVVDTNKVVETVQGWTIGQYSVKNVTRTNLARTNTWTRYRFLSQPGANMAPVLMGQLHCVVTQADTIVASGFGNSADGAYRWTLSDGNGYGTWNHEVATNPAMIVQTGDWTFTLLTNGVDTVYTLDDYMSFRGGDYSYQFRGVGRGHWVDSNYHAAGSTVVSNGWLGWDWDKSYEFYWHNYSPYPYDLPIDRLQPTNVSPALVALQLQDTNYSEVISIPVTVTGPVYVAGVTYGSDAFGLTHVRTGVTHLVKGGTGHLAVAIYDVDALNVDGWSDYWDGGTNPSLQGSTITLWYTNQVPQFGTPHHLTKEAVNERWKLLNVYRSTWRYATLEPGRRYQIASGTSTNSYTTDECYYPGLGAITISNNAPIDPTMRYQWTYECGSQVRKDFGPTIFKQFGAQANEEAQWFETTATVSRLPNGVHGVATWYKSLNPRTTFGTRGGIIVHPTVYTQLYAQTIYDAFCTSCASVIFGAYTETNAVISHPLLGVPLTAFTYRKDGSPASKGDRDNSLHMDVKPTNPQLAARGPMYVKTQVDNCSLTLGPPTFCQTAISFTIVNRRSQAQWGYTFDPYFVTLDWDFEYVTGAPP